MLPDLVFMHPDDVENSPELQVLVNCLTDAAKRMIGRVPNDIREKVERAINEAHKIQTYFIAYCRRGAEREPVGYYSLIRFLCGYYDEKCGEEAVYRLKRFADLCRNDPKNVRLIQMAARNVAEWMGQVLF